MVSRTEVKKSDTMSDGRSDFRPEFQVYIDARQRESRWFAVNKLWSMKQMINFMNLKHEHDMNFYKHIFLKYLTVIKL